jgi:predicted MFS family arabinose efflux permease
MTALAGRRAGQGSGAESRTLVLVSVLLAFEAVLYSTIAPLLPHYAHEFGASRPALGLLVAAYPAGQIPGALLGGWIATRAGVRRTTVVALLMFTVSVVPFGFATDIATLDALRFVQGAACGCIWAGGMTWVVALTPRERRSEALGSLFATVIFGTLVGPLVGTLAVGIGTEVVFAGVGVVSLGLVAWTLRHPEPPRPEHEPQTPVGTLLRKPQVALCLWLFLLEAVMVGATGTLVPLRLSELGASGVAIGLTFVVASLCAAVSSPAIGRVADRRGARLPTCVGLALTAVLVASLPLPSSALVLAALTVATLGGPSLAFVLPSMSAVTETAERIGVEMALASVVLNFAWAIGELVGAPTAAGLSNLTSDTVALVLVSAMMLATLIVVLRTQLIRSASPSIPPDDRAVEASHSDRDSSERISVAGG